MRKSVRRWLASRRNGQQIPLYSRVSWPDFADRMHRAIALDMAVLLGDITLAELRERQETKPLPVVPPLQGCTKERWHWWMYDDKTLVDIEHTMEDEKKASYEYTYTSTQNTSPLSLYL